MEKNHKLDYQKEIEHILNNWYILASKVLLKSAT